jgi:hypothetical protein
MKNSLRLIGLLVVVAVFPVTAIADVDDVTLLKAENTALRSQIDSLRKELKEVQAKLEKVQAPLQTKIEELQKEVAKVQAENKSIKEAADKANISMAPITDEITTFTMLKAKETEYNQEKKEVTVRVIATIGTKFVAFWSSEMSTVSLILYEVNTKGDLTGKSCLAYLPKFLPGKTKADKPIPNPKADALIAAISKAIDNGERGALLKAKAKVDIEYGTRDGSTVRNYDGLVLHLSEYELPVAAQETGDHKPPQITDARGESEQKLLIGKWMVTFGTSQQNWIFHADGTVENGLGDKGKWSFEEKVIRIVWPGHSENRWDTFNRPLKKVGISGDNWAGTKTTAKKVE